MRSLSPRENHISSGVVFRVVDVPNERCEGTSSRLLFYGACGWVGRDRRLSIGQVDDQWPESFGPSHPVTSVTVWRTAV